MRACRSERVERASDADAGVPGRVQVDLCGQDVQTSSNLCEAVFMRRDRTRPDRLPQRLLRMVQKDYFAVNPCFSCLSTAFDTLEVR